MDVISFVAENAPALISSIGDEIKSDAIDTVKTGRALFGRPGTDATMSHALHAIGFGDLEEKTNPNNYSIADNLASAGNAALTVAPIPGLGALAKAGSKSVKLAKQGVKQIAKTKQSGKSFVHAVKEREKARMNYAKERLTPSRNRKYYSTDNISTHTVSRPTDTFEMKRDITGATRPKRIYETKTVDQLKGSVKKGRNPDVRKAKFRLEDAKYDATLAAKKFKRNARDTITTGKQLMSQGKVVAKESVAHIPDITEDTISVTDRFHNKKKKRQYYGY